MLTHLGAREGAKKKYHKDWKDYQSRLNEIKTPKSTLSLS